jgi:site-specific recombinase XerD
MNNPLATLCDQFLKERTFLKNVTPSTLRWYQIAFKNYRATLPDDVQSVPTKASLQAFVIQQRDRAVRPVTRNTYVGAMNAFCRWLHEEHHLSEPLKLQKLRDERRILTLLTDTQFRHLLAFRPKTLRQHRTHVAVCLVLWCSIRVCGYPRC